MSKKKSYVNYPKARKGTFRKMMGSLKPYRGRMLVVILFAMCSTVFSIIGPSVLGKGITLVGEGYMAMVAGTGSIDFAAIGRILLILAGLYVASVLFNLFQGFIVVRVAQSYSYNLRRKMAEKINRLPMSYFDKHSYGDILSRCTNDIDMINQTLNQSLSQSIMAVTTLVGILIMMLVISVRMTIIGALILPATVLMSGIVVRFSQRYFKRQQDMLGEVNGQAEEVFSGHDVLQAFNAEDEVIDSFNDKVDDLFSTSHKSQFFSGIMMPVSIFLTNIGYVGVVIYGAFLVSSGILAIGQIMAFVQYVRRFARPISQIAQVTNIFQGALAAADRVFEFLENEDEVVEPEIALTNHRRNLVESLCANVTFDHVRFGYEPNQIIIKDFSVDVKEGQMVAIVGPTGAGKTTLVKLLMRFYELNGGAIRIDGTDIRELTRNDLRSMFGMVLQDTHLFSGTLMDNIRYGNLAADDEAVVEAAKMARMDHYIRTLPGGYQMEISEAADNLSQGQKQLITIARAVLSDPRILILDEATSSVDTRTEKLVQRAMQQLQKGRTSFVIAHRLSTIRDADLILVLNEGDVVDQGTHDELMAKGGFYADLYNSQFAN
ncbi:MAG TPA: ABC transporter ATP-binding protein [Clostridiaceae bacterium]|nr:ABC transporter ATP-binding protein [Clostridiaceae bacterium]